MCKAVLVLVNADYINSLMDILIISIGYEKLKAMD